MTELAGLLGVWWYHNPDSRRSNPGWPDLVLCGRRGTIFRELKTATGVVSGEQAAWGARLLDGGLDWDVWRPGDLQSGRIARELQAIR